jgi:hypothetical protein
VFAPTSRLRAKVRRSRCSKTTEVHMHWRPRGAASWRSLVDAVTFDGRSLVTAGPGGLSPVSSQGSGLVTPEGGAGWFYGKCPCSSLRTRPMRFAQAAEPPVVQLNQANRSSVRNLGRRSCILVSPANVAHLREPGRTRARAPCALARRGCLSADGCLRGGSDLVCRFKMRGSYRCDRVPARGNLGTILSDACATARCS